jgi:hypothetical protein
MMGMLGLPPFARLPAPSRKVNGTAHPKEPGTSQLETVNWNNLQKMDEVMSKFLPEFLSPMENIKKNFYGMVHFSSKLGGHFCETGKYLATKKLDLHPSCGL